MLHLHDSSTWVAFKYEKLPKFCFSCGLIKHVRMGCERFGNRTKTRDPDEHQYGPWLRVQFPPRRGLGGENRFGSHRYKGHSGDEQNLRAAGKFIDTPLTSGGGTMVRWRGLQICTVGGFCCGGP
jgi:hypothetical protein